MKFVHIISSDNYRVCVAVNNIVGYVESSGKVIIAVTGMLDPTCELKHSYDELTALIKEAQE